MSNASDETGSYAGDDTRPKILLLAPLYPPAYRGGGPIRTTEAMVATHGDHYRFYVITSDTDWGENSPLDVETGKWITKGKAQVLYTKSSDKLSLLRALRAGSKLQPDFIYLNSFLDPRFSILPAALAKVGYFGNSTLILAPRGEFGPAALDIKARKKRFFLTASRLSNLHKGAIWHASSNVEAQDILAKRPAAKIKVRINESTLPMTALRSRKPCAETVQLIFVSRISEIKGVKLLLESLSHINHQVAIEIYGSAQDPEYFAECEELAKRLPRNIQATFHGSVENSKVRELFSNADAFFLPTRHENFGHAVAESLSGGCPVFIEDVTPWTKIIREGGGRIVPEHSKSAWSEALAAYCRLDSTTRTEMKVRAADAYERWRKEQEKPSIFALATDQAEVESEEMT